MKTHQFTIDRNQSPDVWAVGTKHRYTLESLQGDSPASVGSIEFVVEDNFENSLANALQTNDSLSSKVAFNTSDASNGNITVSEIQEYLEVTYGDDPTPVTIEINRIYRHVWHFDIDESGNYRFAREIW